jgi:DNA-binding winged helix-turn-helix (wHTH) protein
MKYRFNDCELDTDSRELTRSGAAVAVEPQVFDLLLYLVEAPGRLIDHAALIESVWNGRIVSDSAIAARISAARKAVGDSGKEQSVIKTLPRRGFRFLPEVELLADAAEPADEPVAEFDELNRQQIQFCKSADGTRIAFARTGHGLPLVRTGHWLTHLEHDWHSPIWRPFLDRLGQHFEVVRYDQRGCGLSDWELPGLALERFVEDLEAVVDASGYERFVLYDTSQGEAILKLIEHGWGVSGSPFLQAFTTMYIPEGNRTQVDSLVELQRLTTSPANAVAIRRAVDTFDVADRLDRVTAKTLVMHAANDGVHPVSQGRDLASGIPDSEFVLLDSDNHAILPQEPAWERFFGELQRYCPLKRDKSWCSSGELQSSTRNGPSSFPGTSPRDSVLNYRLTVGIRVVSWWCFPYAAIVG